MALEYSGLPVPDLSRWMRESGEKPARHWEKVSGDAGEARSLRILIEPCPAYLTTKEGTVISSFYVASNMLHGQAGKRALDLPVKPLLAGFGIGAYGKNGLISIPGIGTRFAVSVMGDEKEPDKNWEWNDDRPLAQMCENCRLCIDACPTKALMGNGRLETENCLRAQAQYQSPPMPFSNRDLIGGSVWGCDICQDICPRNAGIKPVEMPRELENALELKRLLAGDVTNLGGWIGTNYARPARMQARACLVAANLGRTDLYDDIKKLLTSPVEAVRDCAGGALKKLEDKKHE